MLPVNVSPLAGSPASRPSGITESGKAASGMKPLPPESGGMRPLPPQMGLGGPTGVAQKEGAFGNEHEFSQVPYSLGHKKRQAGLF